MKYLREIGMAAEIIEQMPTHEKDAALMLMYRYFVADKISMSTEYDGERRMADLHKKHDGVLGFGEEVYGKITEMIETRQRAETREKAKSCREKRLQAHKQFVDNKSTSQA